jgi:hypothetical protein
METSPNYLGDLIATADHAYQRARQEVFDQLPPRTVIELDRLSRRQQSAIDDLVIAEAELAEYRQSREVYRALPISVP